MLDDIFQALLGGMQSPSAQPQAASGSGQHQDMLSQLLQGALQGQQPPAHAQQPANMAGMADLLGGLLGGSSGSQHQANPLIAPITNMLADKLGLSPAIASMVVNFALTALLSRGKKQGRSSEGLQGAAFDLDDVLNGSFAFDSGMAQKLSQQTGLSEEDAANSLHEAMTLLSSHAAPPAANQQPDSAHGLFDGLIDTLDLE